MLINETVSTGWPGDLCKGAFSLQLGFGCEIIPRVFRCCTVLVKLSPSPPTPPWLEDKNVVSILCFHCLCIVTVPGGCLSQGCHGYPTRSV